MDNVHSQLPNLITYCNATSLECMARMHYWLQTFLCKLKNKLTTFFGLKPNHIDAFPRKIECLIVTDFLLYGI